MLTTRRTTLVAIVLMMMAFSQAWLRPAAMGQTATDASIADAESSPAAMEIPDALQGDFDTTDIAAATAWADQLNLADWLGPLAPLALSPFFGVACLSGLSLWGPEWVTDNALLNSASPLCSVPVFIAFAVLTIITSVPRLTKVSKPFAQSVDRIEAYAVIVILLVIKVMSSLGTGDETAPQVAMMQSPVIIQAGVLSFTADTLLMIAMAINILVVNSVKFFFEFLVWLTPFPTVDAIFELCNKTLCAALMTVYATSPMIATGINLVVLFVALILFRWIGRRVQFHRTMLLDPVLARLFPSYGVPSANGLVAFCKEHAGGYPPKSCLRFIGATSGGPNGSGSNSNGSNSDAGRGRLVPSSRWSPLNWGLGRDGLIIDASSPAKLTRGWLTHTIEAHVREPGSDAPPTPVTLTISRRHDLHLEALVTLHGLELVQETPETAPANRTATAKIEMA